MPQHLSATCRLAPVPDLAGVPVLLLVLVLTLTTAGLAQPTPGNANGDANGAPDGAAPKVLVNLECPVMRGEQALADKYVDMGGRRVYLCCNRCMDKLKANPAKYEKDIAAVFAVNSAMVTPATLAAGELPMFDPFAVAPAADAPEPADADQVDAPDPAPAAVAESTDSDLTSPDQPDVPPTALRGADAATPLGPDAGFLPRLIAWLGKLHPASVNFPVAMLIGAAFAELLLIGSRRPLFEHAGRFCLWIGALGALVAGILGWFWAGFQFVDSSAVLTFHRWLGTLTAIIALCALVAGEMSYHRQSLAARGAYRVLIALAALLVIVNALLGGAVDYGLGYYFEF